MSATRRVVGSQLTPYQPEQQSVPFHVLKMPKYGSVSAALKANRAARSDGVQDLTAEITASIIVSVNINQPISPKCENFASVCVCRERQRERE